MGTRRNNMKMLIIKSALSLALILIPILMSCGSPGVTTTVVTTVVTQAAASPTPTAAAPSTKLAANACYVCHQASTPGITQQFVKSVMAQNDITCSDCHQTAADYPGTQAHYGLFRLVVPTPAKCQACHANEVTQFMSGRHSIPAYIAVSGTQGLSTQMMALYQAIPESSYTPNKSEHPLAGLEGDTVTPYACYACHNIGLPNADNSVGQCQKCHLTHSFSLEQARKPETCNACHIGPDHPQWEIYQESAHGIRYATDGQNWNWSAPAGKMTSQDTPAATCATCHISTFGGVQGSHDVGSRLGTFLFPAISSARPDSQANAQRMQTICKQCHSVGWVDRLYTGAGELTKTVNAWIKQSDAIMADLQNRGLLTAAPFDEPIDFIYFDCWHNYGRTAKFGAWMDGADYSQWHGAYEILRHLEELEDMAAEKIAKAK